MRVGGEQPAAARPSRWSHVVFYVTAVLVFALDQLTKSAVRESLPLGASRPLLGRYLSLTHQPNTGAAFGLLPAWTVPLIVLAVAVVIVLVMWPTLFTIGPIHIGPIRIPSVAIHSYGVMLTVGFLAGILWMRREGKHKGLATDVVLDFALWTLLSSLVCARALFVALNWAQFSGSAFEVASVWRGGLSFHGGVLGAMAAAAVFAVRRKIPLGTLADAGAPAIPLGYAFARIGCFMNGCCHGFPTQLPWRFPHTPTLNDVGVLIPPSHPVQIYDSLMSLAVFGLILLLKPHFRARGQLFVGYIAIYSLQRYIAEFWRVGCSATPFAPLAPLTQAQVAGVVIGVLAAAFLLVEEWRRFHAADPPPAAAPSEPEEPKTETPAKPKKTHR